MGRWSAEWLCQLAATKCLPKMVHCANSCSTFGYLWAFCTLNLPPGALHNFRCCRHALHCAGCFFTSKGEAWLRNAQKDPEMTEIYGFALVGIAVWTDSAAMVRRCWKFLKIRQSHGPFRRVPCPHSASLSSWQTSPFRIPNLKCTMGWEHTSHRPQRKDEQSRAKFQNLLKQCEEMLMLKFRLPWKIIACSSH